MATTHLGGLPLIGNRRELNRAGGRSARSMRSIECCRASRLLFLSPVLAMSALRGALARPAHPVPPEARGPRRNGVQHGPSSAPSPSRRRAERGTPGWAAEQLGGMSVTTEAPLAMRLTPVGWFLRRPRWTAPAAVERPARRHDPRRAPAGTHDYVEHFSPEIYRYSDRHRVTSGMTGLAQMSGLRGPPRSPTGRTRQPLHRQLVAGMDSKIAMKTLLPLLRARSLPRTSRNPDDHADENNAAGCFGGSALAQTTTPSAASTPPAASTPGCSTTRASPRLPPHRPRPRPRRVGAERECGKSVPTATGQEQVTQHSTLLSLFVVRSPGQGTQQSSTAQEDSTASTNTASSPHKKARLEARRDRAAAAVRPLGRRPLGLPAGRRRYRFLGFYW